MTLASLLKQTSEKLFGKGSTKASVGSTNDTCIGLASGAAGNDLIKHSTSEAAQKLEAAVTALLQVLQLPTHRCFV